MTAPPPGDTPARPTGHRPRLAVVVPLYNEADVVEEFVAALLRVLSELPVVPTVILVDDGSQDDTGRRLLALQATHPAIVTVIRLARNFGHQAALTAGMDHADADAVVCMDGDLQHPPELIPTLVAEWQAGHDIVQAVRKGDGGVGPLKRWTSRGFYAVINALGSTRIEPAAADFRLLSRRVVDLFRTEIRERDRFLRGLVAWVGFPSTTVAFEPARRRAGLSKYSMGRMLRLARSGVISFSRVPLTLAVYAGFGVSILSLGYGLFAVGVYLFSRAWLLPGWASTIVVVTFLGGCQLLFLGLIGEYISAILDETKQRPLYVVAEHRPAAEPPRVPGP